MYKVCRTEFCNAYQVGLLISEGGRGILEIEAIKNESITKRSTLFRDTQSFKTFKVPTMTTMTTLILKVRPCNIPFRSSTLQKTTLDHHQLLPCHFMHGVGHTSQAFP
jgi:hypothetical protein